MSGGPSRASVSVSARAIVAGSVTSAATAMAPRISLAAAVPAAASTSHNATCEPELAKRSAMARPMPRAAPVTIATRPERSIMFIWLSFARGARECGTRRRPATASRQARLRFQAGSTARFFILGIELGAGENDVGADIEPHQQDHHGADRPVGFVVGTEMADIEGEAGRSDQP